MNEAAQKGKDQKDADRPVDLDNHEESVDQAQVL